MKLKAPDAVAARARSRKNWFLGICATAFLTIISASAAAPPPSAEELNAAEKWVVERVTAGEVADLRKEFPEEKDRHLSADFLENLLMGTLSGVTLHRHGVQIKWATIDEPIDLENARIPREVHLDNCLFKEPVDFRRGRHREQFLSGRGRFQNKARGTSFGRMKVGGDAFFMGTVFEGQADFFGADIARNFTVAGAKFQKKEKEALFWNMKIGGDAAFNNAVFEGPANFAGADIAGDFEAIATKFQNRKRSFLQPRKSQRRRLFQPCGVRRHGVFRRGRHRRRFRSEFAKFQNKEKGANFNGE